MHFFEILILVAAVLLGGAIPFFIKTNSRSVLKLILSFAGAYLLGITALHLIPEAFDDAQIQTGYWLLGGFFLQIFLEQISLGVEHGHIHPPHDNKLRFVLAVMLGLCIHAFVEGLPLSHYHQTQFEAAHNHDHLVYGIALHHIPAAFALTMLLKFSGFSNKVIIGSVLIFASMSPLGIFTGQQLVLDRQSFQNVLALVIGVFLHVSTTILFEMEENAHHNMNWKKIVAIIVGVSMALLSV